MPAGFDEKTISALSEHELSARLAYLSEFMLPARLDVFRETLAMRTRYLTLCAENTFHTQNASALVRHCEAFGIQDIHTVDDTCRFSPHTNIVRGTDKWIDIRRHSSTAELLADLRGRGYRLVATSPHAGDSTPEQFDVTAGPFALLFGTEHAGISEEVRSGADAFVRIPMCGFVESLNVSASAAILLYILSQRVRQSPVEWRLGERESREILLRWMGRTVRHADRILERMPPAP